MITTGQAAIVPCPLIQLFQKASKTPAAVPHKNKPCKEKPGDAKKETRLGRVSRGWYVKYEKDKNEIDDVVEHNDLFFVVRCNPLITKKTQILAGQIPR